MEVASRTTTVGHSGYTALEFFEAQDQQWEERREQIGSEERLSISRYEFRAPAFRLARSYHHHHHHHPQCNKVFVKLRTLAYATVQIKGLLAGLAELAWLAGLTKTTKKIQNCNHTLA